jgi:hypothetical protein
MPTKRRKLGAQAIRHDGFGRGHWMHVVNHPAGMVSLVTARCFGS